MLVHIKNMVTNILEQNDFKICLHLYNMFVIIFIFHKKDW